VLAGSFDQAYGLDVQDEELIRAAVRGDHDAFRELVERYRGYVFSHIRRQINDHATAEELAQETFLRAHRSLSKFRFDAKFSTWLTRIALNRVSSYFSTPAARAASRSVSFDPLLHAAQGNTEEEILRNERMRRLQTALATLKAELREVMVLVGIEGRSYEEAAEVIGIPVGTVRSRLNTARLALRQEVVRDES